MTEKPAGINFFRPGGSHTLTSYVATGCPTMLACVAGYHTSTGAPSVGNVNVVSPMANGPGVVKVVGPRCRTTGTVSPSSTCVSEEAPGVVAAPAPATAPRGVKATRAAAAAVDTNPRRTKAPAAAT